MARYATPLEYNELCVEESVEMTAPRCPGQNMQYWKPEDIFNVPCPFCRTEIEFFYDEPFRICPSCKSE